MDDDPNVVELRPKKLGGSAVGRAKGLARARVTNHKPAAGHAPGMRPASGLEATGLPAMGESVASVVAKHMGPDAPRRTREGLRLAAMAAMEATLDDADVPAVAKAFVAEKILNRLEGMPTQMTVVADMGDVSNLTAEERETEMADLQHKLGLG